MLSMNLGGEDGCVCEYLRTPEVFQCLARHSQQQPQVIHSVHVDPATTFSQLILGIVIDVVFGLGGCVILAEVA